MSVPPFRVPESLATVPAQGKHQDLLFQTRPPPQPTAAQALSGGLCYSRCLETGARARPAPSLAANAARPARAGAVRMRSGAARGGRGGVVSLSVT